MANLAFGFEKWVKTLPRKLSCCSFAFAAIMVSFTAWLLFGWLLLAVGIIPKTGGKELHFFSPKAREGASCAETNQKMGKLQYCICLTVGCGIW